MTIRSARSPSMRAVCLGDPSVESFPAAGIYQIAQRKDPEAYGADRGQLHLFSDSGRVFEETIGEHYGVTRCNAGPEGSASRFLSLDVDGDRLARKLGRREASLQRQDPLGLVIAELGHEAMADHAVCRQAMQDGTLSGLILAM
jgi:hypothetical protein